MQERAYTAAIVKTPRALEINQIAVCYLSNSRLIETQAVSISRVPGDNRQHPLLPLLNVIAAAFWTSYTHLDCQRAAPSHRLQLHQWKKLSNYIALCRAFTPLQFFAIFRLQCIESKALQPKGRRIYE